MFECRVYLNERADDAEAREAQVLKRPVFAHRVEERVEVQRNVRWHHAHDKAREKGRGLGKREITFPLYLSLLPRPSWSAGGTFKEESPRLLVRRHALQKRERVAHPVRRVRSKVGRRKHRVY